MTDKSVFTLEEIQTVKYLRSRTMDVILRTPQDALNILAQDYAHQTRRFFFHETNFAPEFYSLKTGLAGEILQKFSNYSIKAVILGSFAAIQSPRFRELMGECNRGKQLHFATQEEEAIAWLMAP